MDTSDIARLRDSLEKVFYPLSIVAVAVTLIGVITFFPPRFAIFGSYALIGLIAGAVIYYGTHETHEISLEVDMRSHQMGVYITSALTIGVVALSSKAIYVLVGLGIGYLLLVRQLIANPVPEQVIPQLTVLFLLSPVTKYLTSGRYIGHGDLLIHTRFIEDITVSESLSAISFASYYDFPGLHLIAATFSSLAGLGAYDSLMIIGLVAYTVVIPIVYLVASHLTDNSLLALTTAMAVAAINDLSFFVSYIFPQSLATVLVLVLVLLSILVSRDAIWWRVAWLFTLVSTSLAVTHHLTQILVFPVVLCIMLIYALHGREYAAKLFRSRQLKLIGIGSGISGYSLWQAGFFRWLTESAVLLLQGGLFARYTENESIAIGLGVVPRSASNSSAFEWLTSLYGVYSILLLLVFSIGVVTYLRSSSQSPAHTAIIWTGILGAVLIFETPLSIKSLTRIGFPWLFPFSFVLGIGIYELCRRAGSLGQRQVILLGLVLLLVVAPVTTGDNYYELDPRTNSQTSFSDQEYNELRATASFVAESDQPTTVFWDTRLLLDRFRITELQHASIDEQTIMLPDGYFVYRTAWSDYKASFTVMREESLYPNTVYISAQWLADETETSNKIYTAGETGILWDSTERPFGSKNK